MTPQNGQERRKGALELSVEVEQLRRELSVHVAKNEDSHKDAMEKIDCLSLEMRKFRSQYEDTLKELKDSRQWQRELRDALWQKTAIGVVWALVVLLGFSVWSYVKDHIR